MFKRSPISRSLSLSLCAIASLAALSYYPVAKIRAADTAAKVLSSAARPLVNFKTPQLAAFTYAGDAAAVAALNGGTANATALAAADLNADGAMDVVAGYSTGKNGGVLALFHGNPDAFAPADQSLYTKAMQGKVPPTFLPTASAFSLPGSPDILLTGDFNGDGKKDVLVAARGGSLYLLLGDGHGGLSAPQPVALADQVTAVAVTPDGHAAVGTDGRSGPQVTILAPGAGGLTAMQTYSLPARGESAAWGSLGGGMDLAVGAGSNIVLVYGALRPNPQTETVKLPFQVKAITLGDFISDHDGRTEIAALASDGSIHIFQHGTLKTGPYSAAETAARRALRGHRATPQAASNPTAIGPWTVAKQLPYAGSAPAAALSASGFSTPRLASSSTQDLMVVDGARSQLHILDTSGKTASPSADVAFSGTPVAALALPQTIDSGRDIVVLTSSQAAPTLIHAVPELTLTVGTVSDNDSVGACTNSSYTSPIPNPLSLREAICIANNSAPSSATINLPSGTYDLSLNSNGESGELEIGNASNGYSLNIVGGGSSSTIIKQTDGIDRVMEEDVDLIGGNPLSLSGLTLTGGNCTDNNNSEAPPGDCGYGGGGAIIAGTFPNDDLTLTNVVMSGNSADDPGGEDQGGAITFGGPNLTISGSSFTNNLADIAGGGVQFQDGQGDGGDGTLSITNSIFSGNTAAAGNDGGTGGGLYVYVTTGYSASITGSTFTGNKVETGVGPGGGIYGGGDGGQITVSNSRIVGNTTASNSGNGAYVAEVTGNLENNWWGCNAGPGNSGCDTVSLNGGGSFTPVLTLSISAGSSQVDTDGSTSLTAKLMDGGTCTGYSGNACYVPDGTGVTFSGSLGAVNPSSTSFSSGSATATFLAGNSSGTASVSAVVDNQTVSTNISIGTPPAITSGNAATFTVGTNGSFTVTTSGSPAASLSESGSLPSGVSFVNNGNGTATISGTPNPGTGGQYGFTITAQNGYSPNAMQSFTLTVDQAPTINSSNHTTFSLGTSGSFTVTTAAGTYPSSTTFSESGSLPNGVTFSTSGVLSGTPTQAGSFPITITAANGVSPNATQSFTLTVSQGSTSISVNTVSPSSEAYGQDASITITAVLSWTGTGPAPSASNVVIEGNGQTGSYSATSCGAPVSDTITCSATYTPSGADTVGTYTENAEFVGDSNYGGSGSAQTNNFSITQATSSTSVGSSQNPSIVGQPVTFTATIDGQYGLVVKRNGVAIGGVSKRGASGMAHAASTQKGQAHPADTGFGGTVTWSSNTGCSPSTVSGDPGTAQCVTSTLQQGTDTITATYSGDSNHSGSSATLSGGQVVNPAVTPTSIAVTGVSPSSEAYGQDAQITITAVLMWTGNGPAPTAGNITIGGNGPGGYGATSCGSPSGDSLTCQATYTPTGADTVGSYTETASFSGDSNYTGSSSSQTNNFSITQATSSTSVGSSQNPSIVGQPVTFTATIDGQYGLVVKRNGTVISGGVSKQGASRLTQSRPSALKPVPSSNIGGTVTWSSNTGCSPSTVSGDPGTAQCVTSTLGQGTDTITATYSGDANHSGSSATLSGGQVVNPAVTPTSIAVTNVSPSSEAYGQDATVTITAVLSWTGNGPAPTASDVSIGGNGPSGSYSGTSCGSPSGDTITCQATYTPTAADTVGSYTETASFSGDSNYTGSSSSQTNNFSITQATSSTSVGSSQNPSLFGQPVTFTATIDGQYGLVSQRNGVLPGIIVPRNRLGQRGLNQKQPTGAGLGGTITWSANTGCGTTAVSGNPGTSQCTTSSLAQGTDTITATYSGDSNHGGSSGTLNGGQQVNVGPAITSANNTTFMLNTAGMFMVTTTGSPTPSLSESGSLPNGVTFVDNHNGTGTLSGTPTVGGTFPISFTASNGVGSPATQSFTLSVGLTSTSITLTSSRNPSNTGQFVNFRATVTSAGGTPKGRVSFKNGNTVLGTVYLTQGVANFGTTSLPAGTDVITAVYLGNSTHSPSTSAPINQFVYESTATALQSTANPSSYNQSITLTATVSSTLGAPPDGETVTFLEGEILLGTATLSGGKASIVTAQLQPGADYITASYGGDSTFAGSSKTLLQTVNKAPTTTTLTSSLNPSNFHQMVIFTITVAPQYGGTPNGAVTLFDGSTKIGEYPLSNGSVSVSMSNLSVGVHNLVANFVGDEYFAAGNSATLMQTVNP